MIEILSQLLDVFLFGLWMVWRIYNFENILLSLVSWCGTVAAIITWIDKKKP